MITLRQLRYLDALAIHGHFGRAANDCAVSQPALSMQIRELEAHLGLTLVERRRGKVELTREGIDVVARGRRALNEVRDLTAYASSVGKGLEGKLRLGVIPSIAPYLLPPLLPRLRERFPGLQLQLRETRTDALVAELEQGALDLLLLALPVAGDGLEAEALFEDRFLLAVPDHKGKAAGRRIARDFVDAHELLLLEEGHCLRDQALDYCAMVRPETLTSFGATSLTTILQLVANGYGVTLLPEMCLDVEPRDPRISLLRFDMPEPSRSVGLVWRKSCPRKAAYHAFGELVKDVRAGFQAPD